MNNAIKTKDNMSKELSDSTLLMSALQTLRMISQAHVFNDSYNSKVIVADWKDLAVKEANMIEYKLKLRQDNAIAAQAERDDFGDRADAAYETKTDLDMANE